MAEQPRFDEARQVVVERGRGEAEIVGQLSGVPRSALIEQDVFTEQAVDGRGAPSVGGSRAGAAHQSEGIDQPCHQGIEVTPCRGQRGFDHPCAKHAKPRCEAKPQGT